MPPLNVPRIISWLLSALALLLSLLAVACGFLLIALSLGDPLMTSLLAWLSGAVLGLTIIDFALLVVVLAVDRLGRDP